MGLDLKIALCTGAFIKAYKQHQQHQQKFTVDVNKSALKRNEMMRI